MELRGKRVLVTGGALRVGAAIARAFAAKGAKLVIHYRDSGGQAAELVEALGGIGAGHSCLGFDLEDVEELAQMLEQCGPLDVLVNNASLYERRKLSDETPGRVLKQLSVNLLAPIELMRLFAAQGDSRELAIVNLLDQRIAKVDHETFAYAISKKALAEATLAAALQLAPRVRVNGISPGPVFPPKGLESSKMEKTLASLPLKRAVSPDDLADACVMLVENDSITGSILNVDCGQRLG